MRPIHLCHSEAHGNCERTRTNTADRHHVRRNPAPKLSAPRGEDERQMGPRNAGNSRTHNFYRIKRSFEEDFTSLAGQHPEPLSL